MPFASVYPVLEAALNSKRIDKRGVAIESETIAGESCRFRTAFPVELWPIALDSARLSGRPLVAPAITFSSRPSSPPPCRMGSSAFSTRSVLIV